MKNLIVMAIPGFIILLIAEFIVAYLQKKHDEYFDAKDTASSISMGIGNVLIGFVSKAMIPVALTFVFQFRFFTMPENAWWAWILCLLADDFSYYWFHRTSHSVRYFWASHVVHHSSQKYNLGTALRQTWTGNLSGSWIFWLWMPLVGFSPLMIMTMMSISLLYQFWIHTEVIKRLPKPIEFIFNTPSHHRVHHASDIQYLDRNHAGILIIWDRMFGTFVEENVHPTYGLTKNLETHNPLHIAFDEWGAVIKDVWKAPTFKAKIGYLFGPPGWSHDGSRKTSGQLRKEEKQKVKEDQNRIKQTELV
ncbi:sterol desaturase family protein [Solitalea sp. MAHUQ-68]|uniref:Sterol desaturase family protein n=1 Tax=Solitalea agri TaxID=2953739 RepID=A0A9X2JAQ7_9SPHI|nr:sterol desaturase family protein [Solitalea agri]MCO4291697.1 sterol desaturase family protein [Solitalea agri]